MLLCPLAHCRHPVVNDGGMVLWRALGVASWPTLMVVGPTGRAIATLAGRQGCIA